MKKILSNFVDSLISRDQMKKVKGGCGNGTCAWAGTITCSNGVSHACAGQTIGDATTMAGYLCNGGSYSGNYTGSMCY